MKLLPLLVRQGDRAIDIGANRGIYAYQLWRLGSRLEVFEPNPICFSVLESWAAGRPEVQLHSVALSNHAGTANLHIPIDGSGVEHDASASIEHSGTLLVRNQLVSLQTLDSYSFENVSFIKIDVEGHEYAVLEGTSETIALSRPALLIEIEQRHNGRPISDVFEKVQRFGYQGFFLEQGVLRSLEKFDLSRHQSISNFGGAKGCYINNFLFLHRSRLEAGDYGALINGLLK